jgi:hypothetical protein
MQKELGNMAEVARQLGNIAELYLQAKNFQQGPAVIDEALMQKGIEQSKSLHEWLLRIQEKIKQT